MARKRIMPSSFLEDDVRLELAMEEISLDVV